MRLAAAVPITCDDNTRYDLRNIQLRAHTTEIVATDGHQLLIQRTDRPVWDCDVLVRRAPLFASKAVPRDRPVRLGKTDSHVVLQIGDLTIWLTIQTEARFPRLDGALPADSERVTCLQLEAADAAFLASALDRLPGGDAENAPVTVDLNGQVAIRARAADEPPTEVILSRSRYTGTPMRLSTNRAFLGRALALGLDTIRIAGPDQPLVAQDETRTFAWQPLNRESAIAPTEAAQRIEPPSTTQGNQPVTNPPETPRRRTLMPERVSNNGHSTTTTSNGNSTGSSDVTTTLAQLLREAESLHAALGMRRTQTAKLIAGLRTHRKKSRLVQETLPRCASSDWPKSPNRPPRGHERAPPRVGRTNRFLSSVPRRENIPCL